VTSNIPEPTLRDVIDRLDRIDANLKRIDERSQKTDTCLNSLFSGMVTVLVSIVGVAGLTVIV
jgi:hypothetical protein